VGLGFLGRSVAACLLSYGFSVRAYDRRQATQAFSRQYIARAIDDLIQYAGFAPSLANDWPGRYLEVKSLDQFSNCDFVVESVTEDVATKQAVFDQIEAVVSPQVPIASNTSAIPITRLQSARKHPERFVGMHWAEPAHATRFMELIRGEKTSDEVFERTAALAKRIGKEPSLVQKDVPAFIVNRLGYALYREAFHLLEAGVADEQTIDRCFRNAIGLWATIAGPFRWMDLTGGPASYARTMKSVLPTLSNATQLPKLIEDLAQSDARGIANGRGFFQYSQEEARNWEELFIRHAWTIRKLLNDYFPLEKS
jgi:3-hydroxybutyryl-CoA dehydrogenase